MIRATNVGFERRQRRSRRHADERLRTKMDDGVHFPDTNGALDRGVILERAIDLLDLVDIATANQFALRVQIDAQGDNGRAAFEQRLHYPRADNARRAGHQDSSPAPGRCVAHARLRNRRGARPSVLGSLSLVRPMVQGPWYKDNGLSLTDNGPLDGPGTKDKRPRTKAARKRRALMPCASNKPAASASRSDPAR